MILLTTITSYLPPKTVYGVSGDVVELISTRGDVLIVENNKGVKFSVRVENVGSEAVEVKPVALPSKVTKAAPEQTSLF